MNLAKLSTMAQLGTLTSGDLLAASRFGIGTEKELKELKDTNKAAKKRAKGSSTLSALTKSCNVQGFGGILQVKDTVKHGIEVYHDRGDNDRASIDFPQTQNDRLVALFAVFFRAHEEIVADLHETIAIAADDVRRRQDNEKEEEPESVSPVSLVG